MYYSITLANPFVNFLVAGENIDPLRMIIHGKGEMSKSHVIQTITEFFEFKGVSSLLVKGAFTGIAASLIRDKTLHNMGHIPILQTTKAKAEGLCDEAKKKTPRVLDDIHLSHH